MVRFTWSYRERRTRLAVDDEDEVVNDGPGTYRVKAVISHMGTSTTGGHYVCHVKKDGEWVFFNDSKVAQSEVPPLKYGYMYLYERV